MAHLMVNVVKRHKYETLTRQDTPQGRRYVNRHGEKLPSVTTILDKTKDQTKLIDWINRVGEQEAERIKREAAAVGTSMHAYIEAHVKMRPIPCAKFPWQYKAYRMAAGLMETYFPDLDEIWGNEVMVYQRGVYAGTTDLVGVFRGQPSIVDFKQSNKMKKREWIDDYFVQLTAYAAAHNEMYGTEIRQGVVLMASQDGLLKDFIICGREFDSYLDQWNAKVKEFYKLMADAAELEWKEDHLGTTPDTAGPTTAEEPGPAV
jgi:CRISPR/Cas system-associated exonuclease Cas4 (RecB family)